MRAFLTWIESSALGDFVRESSTWTYPLVNLAHVLGIATLFGSVLVIDLALLAAWWKRSAAHPAVVNAAAPVAATGFAIAVTSGISLLSSNATEYIGNPFFMIKFPVIALAAGNALAVNRSRAWQAVGRRELTVGEIRQLAGMSAMSLICWIGAIAAGRMIGYW